MLQSGRSQNERCKMGGVHSKITAEAIISEARKAGVVLWVENGKLKYRAPEGAMTAELKGAIKQHREEVMDRLSRGERIEPNPEDRWLPFPLTDIQSSYLLGRGVHVEGGGVSCHAYFEIPVDEADLAQLQLAFAKTVERHDALRTAFDESGYQQVSPFESVTVPSVLSRCGETHGRDDLRALMSHTIHDNRIPPLMSVGLSSDEGRPIIHVSVDFLVADWSGITRIIDDLVSYYRGQKPSLRVPKVTFRDYVLAAQSYDGGGKDEEDKEYWDSRLTDFSEACSVPLLDGEWGSCFTRFHFELSESEWLSLESLARSLSVSASAVILAAYSRVIAEWSEFGESPIVVTLFDRLPLHEDVPLIVGDFTSTGLVVVSQDGSLGNIAASAFSGLMAIMSHRSYSGVQVMRDVVQKYGMNSRRFPFVFTSAVSRERDSDFEHSWDIEYGITQTPQVGVDFQAATISNCLHVNWDVRDGVLADGVAEAMFEAFEALLRGIASGEVGADDEMEVGLPAPQASTRLERQRRADSLGIPARPEGLLHDRLLEQAAANPLALAVADGEGSTTYADLARRAGSVAAALAEAGAGPGDRVGVCMPKGAPQIASVLGALMAGCCYVPIDPHLPEARKAAVLEEASPKALLAPACEAGEWAAGAAVIDPSEVPDRPCPDVPRALPSDPAYVIFTSGSTGVPRGVVVSHGAAKNTVEDVCERFGVSPSDVALGVSGLGFDLSVFDVFGVLGRGGSLALVEQGGFADPSKWLEACGRLRVTLWNSAPAQMSMLLDSAGDDGRALSALRLVLLSGDWVPVDVMERVRRFSPDAEVVALGGATEAAIWSNFHIMDASDSSRASVPYGVALAHQSIDVCGPDFRSRPDHVVGDICISGAGLADGYLGHPELTSERFVVGPDGVRRYVTGDLGRWLPEGEIEFLGRRDTQVKIRGNRIELSEVEAAAKRLPQVADSCALVLNDDDPYKQCIALCVRPKADRSRAEDMSKVADKAFSSVVFGVFGGLGKAEVSAESVEDAVSKALTGIMYRYLMAAKAREMGAPLVVDNIGDVSSLDVRLQAISGFDCKYFIAGDSACGLESVIDDPRVEVVADGLWPLPDLVEGCGFAVFKADSEEDVVSIGEAVKGLADGHAWLVVLLEGSPGDERHSSERVDRIKSTLGACHICSLDYYVDSHSASILLLVFDDGLANVSQEDVVSELKKTLPAAEVPAHVEVISSFPTTINGKVDRALLKNIVNARVESANDSDSHGRDEYGVLKVVREVMKAPSLNASDNLLAAGANSLVFARIIARMREQIPEASSIGFDVFLRAVLDNPRAVALESVIGKPDGICGAQGKGYARQAFDGGIVHYSGPKKEIPGRPARVVVHTAIGSLDWLFPLMEGLSSTTKDPVYGIVVPNVSWYTGADPSELIDLCGSRYAEFIVEEGIQDVQVIGFCIGGMIATSISSHLEAAGVRVNSTVLLDSIPLTFEVEDEFFLNMMFVSAMGLGIEALGLSKGELEGAGKAFELAFSSPGGISREVFAGLKGDPEIERFAAGARRFYTEGIDKRISRYARLSRNTSQPMDDEAMRTALEVFSQSFKSSSKGLPVYFGDLTFMQAEDQSAFLPSAHEEGMAAWKEACIGDVDVRVVPGNHFSMIARPNVESLVHEINVVVDENAL